MPARVLVVDDLVPNVKLLSAKLQAEYFDVMTASSGPEALAKIAESPARFDFTRRYDAWHGWVRGLPPAQV